MDGLEFNAKGFDAVVVPNVLLGDPDTRSSQVKQRLAHSQRYTCLGQHLFEKRLLNYSTTSIVLAKGDTADVDSHSVDSDDPDIGHAWIRADLNIDPATARIHNPILGNPGIGGRNYYPQDKHELRHVSQIQSANIEDRAEFFGALVPDARNDIIRYLTAPCWRKPYTLCLNPWFYDVDIGHPSDRGIPLKNTCHLLNDEVKKAWLKHNVFLFYDPQQFITFLSNLIPKTLVLRTGPSIFKHVILNIKTCAAAPWYLRSLEHTTIVPLSAKPLWLPDYDNMEPYVGTGVVVYPPPVVVPNPNHENNSELSRLSAGTNTDQQSTRRPCIRDKHRDRASPEGHYHKSEKDQLTQPHNTLDTELSVLAWQSG